MAKGIVVCDICNEPICAKDFLATSLYEQYQVKIKHIEEGWSFTGFFRNTNNLDICPSCMKKFVEFVRKEQP